MPLMLPRVFVPAEGLSPDATSSEIAADELAALSAYPHRGAERVIARPRGRWAVCRDVDGGTVWRLGDAADRDRLAHPAWLWTIEEAFLPDAPEEVAVPAVLPMRALMPRAAGVGGDLRTAAEVLAAAVAALRRRRQPVAIVAPSDALTDAERPAMWLALALLTALPPKSRGRLRISTFEIAPDPDAWDIVFTPQMPRAGFSIVRTDAPPGVETDLVAAYIVDRLLAKDPEAVEAAAFASEGDGDDPWADGVRALLRTGMPGFSTVDANAIDADREQAVQGVIARLKAGAELHGTVVADLVAVTVRTGDSRPWRLVRGRPADERDRALRMLFAHLQPSTANEPLLRQIGALGPFGASLPGWVGFLVRCMVERRDPAAAYELLEEVLIAEGEALSVSARASIWQQVIAVFLDRQDATSAVTALLSKVSRRIATDGAPGFLVHGFLALPHRDRTANLLKSLTDALAHAPDADLAMRDLYRGLLQDAATDENRTGAHVARLVLQHWARLRSLDDGPAPAHDRLLEHVRGTPHARDWIAMVARQSAWESYRALILPVIPSGGDGESLWAEAELARASSRSLPARERLVAMSAYLPEGRRVLEALARELLIEASPTLWFPDVPLSTVAAEFAEHEGNSPLWAWIAALAAPRGMFADASLDAAIAGLARAQLVGAERETALRAVAALATAEGWSTVEQAAWLARFLHADASGGRGLPTAIGLRFVRALADLRDGPHRVAVVTRELMSAGPNDRLRHAFVADILPRVWDGPVPDTYVDAMLMSALPDEAMDTWRSVMRKLQLSPG
jgi:hypothetical protein